MRVFDPRFHTFASKFFKINTKNFCKCHFMRVFENFSTLLILKNCGNFMIWPHFCHNMCQSVATTPISTLETRCHLLETFEKKFVLWGFLTPVSTLSPLNFVKSTQKIFANVILWGFLIPSSTLLVCKKCGHFMIWPHCCLNLYTYVAVLYFLYKN